MSWRGDTIQLDVAGESTNSPRDALALVDNKQGSRRFLNSKFSSSESPDETSTEEMCGRSIGVKRVTVRMEGLCRVVGN
jgi:hypothetical protein